MPVVVTNLDALASKLRACQAASGLIGVDGWTGVGKTTLAEGLVGILGGSCYDLDHALTPDQKQYVSALRFPELSEALAQQKRPLFVSGICLLEVLVRVGVSLDAHVYVKRMATWGWPDEDELTGQIPEVGGASGASVRIELRAYHEKWKPHLVADYEFQRLS